jgi:hypothetical protein
MNADKLKKLITEVKKENSILLPESQQIVEMSGFSRIRQIMLGHVPSVDSIALLTAENPDAIPATASENKAFMKSLKDKLQAMNSGYTDIGGSFGSPEKSVFIMNISRDDAVMLGREYSQEAVIWGEKRRTNEEEPYFRFEYIEVENPLSPADVRNVSLGGTDVQYLDDYYSEKGDRKFVIPFFDTRYEPDKVKRAPMGRRISFVKEEYENIPNARALVKSINNRAALLQESARTIRSKWHHRNLIQIEMRKLKNLILLNK